MRDFDQMSLLFNMKYNGAKANLKLHYNYEQTLSVESVNNQKVVLVFGKIFA